MESEGGGGGGGGGAGVDCCPRLRGGGGSACGAAPVMSPAGCSHVNSFKADNWKQSLRVIYQCFVWSGTAESRKRKVSAAPGRAGKGCG